MHHEVGYVFQTSRYKLKPFESQTPYFLKNFDLFSHFLLKQEIQRLTRPPQEEHARSYQFSK